MQMVPTKQDLIVVKYYRSAMRKDAYLEKVVRAQQLKNSAA